MVKYFSKHQNLFELTESTEDFELCINLKDMIVTLPNDEEYPFEFDQDLRNRLLQGLDDIALTLQYSEDIRNYEKHHQSISPWRFN